MPHILLYTMGHCPYCKRAKALLHEKGVEDYEEFDLEVVPAKRAEMIARSGGRKTVPQIFIGGTHVGGADDLFELDAEGGLDPLLTDRARTSSPMPAVSSSPPRLASRADRASL